MAWISAWKAGNFTLSVIKEEYFNFFLGFGVGDSNVGSGASSNIFDNRYLLPPVNMAYLFNKGVVNVGDVVKIAVLPNGKYIGCHVDRYTNNQYATSGNVTYFLYNANGSKFSTKALGSTPINVRNDYSPTEGYPYYISLLYNEETKEAAFIVLCINSGYQNNKTFWGSTTSASGNSNFLSRKELYNFIKGSVKEYDLDPWSNAGYAGIGGGDGTFDYTSDSVGLPSVPNVDSVSTGFLQLFCGSLDKIVELSRYMWSTNFFDNIVKLTSNPIDIIMGLYMYPFTIPTSAGKYVRAGNVLTNISMGVPDSQIFEIDCGTFPVPQFYGAYLDYEPFSKCEIYLPYCGTFNLSMDDISGKTLSVKYRVDLLTGLCVAYVIIDGTVRYNFTGSCAVNIPISSRSFENLYNSIMGLVGSMFGGGNFSAPSIGSVAGAVSSGKNQITHGGIASGNAGFLGVQKPYLIFNIPRVAIPKGLNTYTGYPIFATYKLGDLTGYTEVEEIHLENMGTATKDEIDRVVSLLKGGVIL